MSLSDKREMSRQEVTNVHFDILSHASPLTGRVRTRKHLERNIWVHYVAVIIDRTITEHQRLGNMQFL